MFLSNGRVILRFFNPGASFFPRAGGLILKALNQAQKERQFEPPRAPSSPRKPKINFRFSTFWTSSLFVVLGALGGQNGFVIVSKK
jgi:hypothetical protein